MDVVLCICLQLLSIHSDLKEVCITEKLLYDPDPLIWISGQGKREGRKGNNKNILNTFSPGLNLVVNGLNPTKHSLERSTSLYIHFGINSSGVCQFWKKR